MVLDEMEDELINSDEFLYFPAPNRIQIADKLISDGVLLDEEQVIGIFREFHFISSAIFRPPL